MDNIITLNSDSGKVHFEFLDLIEHCGEEYLVLIPADDPENIGEVVILKVETADEETTEETYVGVASEETLQVIFNIFKSKFKDIYNFVDETYE